MSRSYEARSNGYAYDQQQRYDEGDDDQQQHEQQHVSTMRRSHSATMRRPASGRSQLPHSASSSTTLAATQRPSRSHDSTAVASGSNSSTMNKNFKVVVRIRPPLPRELDPNGAPFREIVRTEENHRVVAICENGLPPSTHDGYNTTTTANADGTFTHNTNTSGGIYATHKFTFDHVYDQDTRQIDVYQNTARDAVMSTLQGYNATILAYGQTGTGKTFSMEGFPSSSTSPDDNELRGIIPRSVEEIFNYIQNTAHTNVRFLVRASYLQIYNEVISDLLKPERSNLNIREDKKKGVFVEGLSEWVVRSPKEVYGLIKRGTSLRATGATRINETSSRSHALFIIIVEQNEMIYEEDPNAAQPTPGMDRQEKARTVAGSSTLVRQSFKVGKLNLVDLAGSERVRISGAKGRRLEESKYINQSLSALGNVISALTEGNRSHVPYRDSRLTRILEDSFGGNVKSTLLATISPSQEAFLESLSTLKFANRAKNIKNIAQINEDLDEKALLRRYERELKKLRSELQAKSKNVVDKRKLIEVEEQRRRAEQDKMQALMNMERLSRDLLQEKNQKKKLEERIKEMNSQLLVGGTHGQPDSAASDAAREAESAKAFQQALQVEQDRIRAQYTAKLAELERERETMEEEKSQTSRYKQLLLKQRDIMIQLTARLNERDQSILLLQEELDAYDKHQRAMEDELDQKRHRLIQLQRMNVGDNSATANGDIGPEPSSPLSHAAPSQPNLYGLFPIDEAPYFEENGISPQTSPSVVRTTPTDASTFSAQAQPSSQQQQQLQQPSSASSHSPAPSSFGTPSGGVDPAYLESEVSRRVAHELARRDAQAHAQLQSAQVQLADLNDALRSRESEALRLREELERLRRQPSPPSSSHDQQEELAALRAQNAQLVQNVAALQSMLQNEKIAGGASTSTPSSDDRARLMSLQKKYDVQLQERAALKVILERKMKTLIDSIANAALHGQVKSSSAASPTAASPASSATAVNAVKDALPSRTKREIEVLQRLVDASLNALKSSDEQTSPSPPSSSQSDTGMQGAVASISTPSPSPPVAAAPHSSPSPSPSTSAYLRPSSASPYTTGSTFTSSMVSNASNSAAAPLPSTFLPRASAPGTGASTSSDIEQLIQQRRAQLMNLDERMR